MPKTIQVKGSSDDRKVVLWERANVHPTGEAFVANNGKAVTVAETAAIKRLLGEGRLVQVQGTQQTPVDGLTGLGLTPEQEQALTEAGYSDREKLAAASDDDLTAVKSVGKATVENIRKALA